MARWGTASFAHDWPADGGRSTFNMALLKFLRRPGAASEPSNPGAPSAAAQAVQAAREQARRRLMGAVVLLGIGIIGFPLVFQTQPRPLPVDIPIEIPNREQVPALVAAAGSANPAPASPLSNAGQGTASLASRPSVGPVPPVPVEVEVLPPSRGEAAEDSGKDPAREGSKDGSREADKDGPKESPKDAAEKERGRFVVQVGSYTDLDTVREVRQKLERMGIKTYTQAAVIEGATRVRVRAGPFSSRQEAQEVQSKLKATGVAASLLQL